MIIKNKIEKPFGAGGSSTGLFLFIAGIIITYFSLLGLIFVLSGAFIAFTSVSTFVDIDNRRIKCSTYLFGIIPIGKWIEIKYGMKIGLKKSNCVQRISTRANSLDIYDKDFRIMLYSFDNQKIMPIKRCDSKDAAKIYLEELSNQLELVII